MVHVRETGSEAIAQPELACTQSLKSCTLLVKQINIFTQSQRSRKEAEGRKRKKREEEDEVSLNEI